MNHYRIFHKNPLSSASQGHLLEIHLLESQLLDTFFQNVNYSTQLLDTQKDLKT
jgi:hypothetical protein